jgi:hypothetical protein
MPTHSDIAAKKITSAIEAPENGDTNASDRKSAISEMMSLLGFKLHLPRTMTSI